MRLLGRLAVVLGEVVGQANHQLTHRGAAPEIDLLMLDVPAEALDEDVVENFLPSIHANHDAFTGQLNEHSSRTALKDVETPSPAPGSVCRCGAQVSSLPRLSSGRRSQPT